MFQLALPDPPPVVALTPSRSLTPNQPKAKAQPAGFELEGPDVGGAPAALANLNTLSSPATEVIYVRDLNSGAPAKHDPRPQFGVIRTPRPRPSLLPCTSWARAPSGAASQSAVVHTTTPCTSRTKLLNSDVQHSANSSTSDDSGTALKTTARWSARTTPWRATMLSSSSTA